MTLFLTYAVPPPDVNFDLTSPDTITYTGNSVTLNCRITLLGGVTDSDVVVNSTWTKDGAVFSGVSDRVTVPPQIRVNTRVFIAQMVFSPLSPSMDNGTYKCVATVTPSQPEFVTGAMGSRSMAFAVRGKVFSFVVWHQLINQSVIHTMNSCFLSHLQESGSCAMRSNSCPFPRPNWSTTEFHCHSWSKKHDILLVLSCSHPAQWSDHWLLPLLCP